MIEELGFPGYFLVVHDIVRFAREADILCQGRGSAANSAACYALGITNADAVSLGLLFERFLSPERDGPPDIDIDIESGRREEVIQYVYERHGRSHAAQVANVITYRSRSAVRDMAKALGYAQGQQDAFAKRLDRWTGLGKRTAMNGPGSKVPSPVEGGPMGKPREGDRRVRGVDISSWSAPEPGRGAELDQIPPQVLELARQIEHMPRHLGIHSGGMVICDRPITEVCPTEWGRMADRSVLQWDKEDCAAIGLVKFDLLGLGMLTAIHLAVDLIDEHHGTKVDLAHLEQQDAVYDMLCRADTVGVFQIESRAQMATLPRLAPRTFYDLVVEIALIRPGPIQGGSVHPYIRRRKGEEEITYLHPLLESSLAKTLGVPLFQEQLMQMAIDVAGFTPAEADLLRQAMGSKRSNERMGRLRARFEEGATAKGVSDPVVREQIWIKLAAFANYGFPESHSVSFAYLVYSSSWIKLHYPAAFCAALINAQPMGFYSPHSLVQDARRHGVEVRTPCVNRSGADAVLEPISDDEPTRMAVGPNPTRSRIPQPAVRLGVSSVRGVGDDMAERIGQARPFPDIDDLARRARVNQTALEALATAGALDGLVGADSSSARRTALWSAGAVAQAGSGRLPGIVTGVKAPRLPGMSAFELAIADMWATGVSPEGHPTRFVRDHLTERGVLSATDLATAENRSKVLVGGVVTHRQRPATASGVTFLNLEDETGFVNVVCSPGFWVRYRPVVGASAALVLRGVLERTPEGVINVRAEYAERLELVAPGRSRDFR